MMGWNALVSSDVAGLPYLSSRNQAICWLLPHRVHADGGYAQHRWDGHHHHLKTQFDQNFNGMSDNTKPVADETEDSGGAVVENVDTQLQQMQQHNHEIVRSEFPTVLL